MTKLINSVDKASCRFTEAEREKALQRPVMSFICQRHDLDGLQLAMRQALRKATCRVFAMQVMILGQLPANISIQSTLFNPYQSYICFSPKMLYAYYICIYSNAPKATFIMTANSLNPDQREQSYQNKQSNTKSYSFFPTSGHLSLLINVANNLDLYWALGSKRHLASRL